MALIRPIREGSWWIYSKKDSKWNRSGRGFVGGLMKPDEVDKVVEELKKELGEPPDDLEWGYMKD